MANRPIISIDIDDANFKRFYAQFKAYSEELDAMPDAWKKVNASMSAGDISKGLAKTSDLLAISATQTSLIVEAMQKATESVGRFGSATAKTTSQWDKLGRSVTGVAGKIGGIAKTLVEGVLFAGGLTAIGSGFGIDALANSVTTNQRQATGLGVSVGQMRAWQANMAPFVGTNILQGAAAAQLDPSQFGYLSALGITGAQAQGMNPAQLATQISNAARNAYRQNSNTNTAQAQAFFALGGTEADWRNLGTASGGALRKAENNASGDAGALGLSSTAVTAWQTLSVTLEKAGYKIQSGLIDGLEPLAPLLTNLSNAVSNGITAFLKSPELQADLQSFTDWLSSPDFTTDLKTFGDAIKSAGQDVLAFIGWLSGKGGVPSAPGTPPVTANNSQNEPGLKGIFDRFPIALGGKGNGPNGLDPNTTLPATGIYGNAGDPFKLPSGNLNASIMPASARFKPGSFGFDFSNVEKKYGLPAGMMARLGMDESGLHWDRTSAKGAQGMFQLMPATSQWLNVNPWSPGQSAYAAGYQLSQAYKKYGSWDKAVAAYNLGGGNLDKDIAAHGAGWKNFLPSETLNEMAAVTRQHVTSAVRDAAFVRQNQSDTTMQRPGMGDLGSKVNAVLAQLRMPTKVALNISNSTASRVAVAANSAIN